MVMKRAVLNTVIVLSIAWLPWWVTAIFILFGFAYFHSFFEGVAWGAVMDILYGAPLEKFGGLQFVFSVSSLAVFFLIERLKRNIRFYRR